MSDWLPPGSTSEPDPHPDTPSHPQPPPQPPPQSWAPPAPAPPPWTQPWATPLTGPAATALPWYRSTVFLVLGGLGMLLLGGLLGGGLAVLGVGLAETIGEGGPYDATTYGPGGDLAVFSIGAGQCGRQDVFEAHTYPEGSAVACSDDHAIEHYAEVEPPALAAEGARFDDEELANFADAACYVAFEPYVGLDYESSDFDYLPIVPSNDAWDAGERTVHCVLFEYDGSTSSGTANDSGR